MKRVLLPLLLANSVNLFAQDNNSYLENFLTSTTDQRKDIHNYLIAISTNLDNYVDNSKIDMNQYSSTYGLIQFSAFQDQHGSVKFDQKVKLKLKLPKLKDRFRLVFESDEIDENKDFVEDHKTNNNDDFNLGLSYEALKKDYKFKAKVGLKLRSKLDPFLKLSLNRTWEDIYYDVDYTLGQTLKQSVIKKLESTSYMRFDKSLKDYYSLHNYSEYYWQSEESRNSQIINSTYLNQQINSKNYLTYTVSTNIDNQDTNLRIKRNTLQIHYRHFIKKWLYVDTIPENYYSYDNNFKPRYAIRFNLGIYFNKSSYN